MRVRTPASLRPWPFYRPPDSPCRMPTKTNVLFSNQTGLELLQFFWTGITAVIVVSLKYLVWPTVYGSPRKTIFEWQHPSKLGGFSFTQFVFAASCCEPPGLEDSAGAAPVAEPLALGFAFALPFAFAVRKKAWAAA